LNPTRSIHSLFLILGLLGFQFPFFGQDTLQKSDTITLSFEYRTGKSEAQFNEKIKQKIHQYYNRGFLAAEYRLEEKNNQLYAVIIPGKRYTVAEISIRNTQSEKQLASFIKRNYGIFPQCFFQPKQLPILESNRILSQWEIIDEDVHLYLQGDTLKPGYEINGQLNGKRDESGFQLEGRASATIRNLSYWRESLHLDWTSNASFKNLELEIDIQHLFLSPYGAGFQLLQWINESYRQFRQEALLSYSFPTGIRVNASSISDKAIAENRENQNNHFLGGEIILNRKTVKGNVSYHTTRSANKLNELEGSLSYLGRKGNFIFRPSAWIGLKTGDYSPANLYHLGGYTTVIGVDQGSLDFQKGWYQKTSFGYRLNKELDALCTIQTGEIDAENLRSIGLGLESFKQKRKLFLMYAFSNLAQLSQEQNSGKLHFGWSLLF